MDFFLEPCGFLDLLFVGFLCFLNEGLILAVSTEKDFQS